MCSAFDIAHNFSSVPHALESAVAARRGLPPFEAADVELAIARVEPRPHDAGVELEREEDDSALRLPLHFLLHDVKEAALAV